MRQRRGGKDSRRLCVRTSVDVCLDWISPCHVLSFQTDKGGSKLTLSRKTERGVCSSNFSHFPFLSLPSLNILGDPFSPLSPPFPEICPLWVPARMCIMLGSCCSGLVGLQVSPWGLGDGQLASVPCWVPGIAEGPGLPTWKPQVEPDGQGGQGAGPRVGVELP